MVKDPSIVDQFSAIPFVIQISFNNIYLSHATGFIYSYKNKNYLITNWHVLSGRNAETENPLDKNQSIPNNLTIYPTIAESNRCRRLTEGIKINLQREDDSYLWLEHPEFSNNVDVAAIEIPNHDYQGLVNINSVINETVSFETYIAQDVFILGYPLEYYLIRGFPIWKRGTIATPPMFNVSDLPKYLIDTATRSGMSGSPVFASFLNNRFRKLSGELTNVITNDSFFCAIWTRTTPPRSPGLSRGCRRAQPYAAYRAFRAAWGLAPSEYQRLLRLRAARGFLASGVPPAEAATAAGFADQAHLTRWFRRCYGITPAEFRRALGVVENERREIGRRVRQAVQRLRARCHDLRVKNCLRFFC